MADFWQRTVRKAIRTDAGLETFSISGVGVPKGAMFFPTLCTADSTAVVDATLGFGVTDGTGNFAIAASDEDAETTSNTNRGISSTKCLYALQGDGTLAFEGDFDSFNTDNVVIDITDNSLGAAVLVTCVLWGGDDLAEIGVGTYLNNNGGNTYTGLGFSEAPDFAVLCNRADAATSGIATQASFHLGAVDFNGNQAGATWGSNDNVSAQSAHQETWEAGAAANSQGQSITSGTQWEAFLDAPTADGWDVNIATGSPGGDLSIYIAFRFTNSPGIQVFSDTMPTGAGNFDYSGAPFTPGFLLGVQTENTAFDTYSGAAAGVAILTADATNQYCNAMSVEDAATTMNSSTISGATLFDSLNSGTTESYVGTLTGFTGDGYDGNLSVAEPSTSPHVMWGVLFEEPFDVTGRVMSSLASHGGLAGKGGIAGSGGGLAG